MGQLPGAVQWCLVSARPALRSRTQTCSSPPSSTANALRRLERPPLAGRPQYTQTAEQGYLLGADGLQPQPGRLRDRLTWLCVTVALSRPASRSTPAQVLIAAAWQTPQTK